MCIVRENRKVTILATSDARTASRPMSLLIITWTHFFIFILCESKNDDVCKEKKKEKKKEEKS